MCEEVDLDQIRVAIENVLDNKMVPEECANVAYQHAMIIIADAYNFDRLETARMKVYRQWFDECVAPCGEIDLLEWIRRYKNWTNQEIRELLQTHGDLVGYARRHGTSVPYPEIFMQVSPIEGGSLGHLDRITWLWNVIERERLDLLRTNYAIPLERVPEQLQYLAHVAREYKPAKRAKPERQEVQCMDLEEIASGAAPCMRAILRRNAFPKDKERVALIGSMMPHFSDESIIHTLVTLHRREDKGATEESTRKRWNYKYGLEKRYKPSSCCNIRSLCPFPETHKGAAQEACWKVYAKERPNVKWRMWWGPSMWWQKFTGNVPKE